MMKKDPDPWLTDPDVDPGGPKHTYPTNPDPQHWFLHSQTNARKSAMLNEIYLGIDEVDAIQNEIHKIG